MPQRTLKVVIVGPSGVGKTSLRNQYLHGKFSPSYRATIGADFITKNITLSETEVSLAIWDTAGQERFSSLSTAFFRGADACILVFDATSPSSLASLRNWYKMFCDIAPVPEGSERHFCFVAVGNKTDKLSSPDALPESEAKTLFDELIPPLPPPPPPPAAPAEIPKPTENGEPVNGDGFDLPGSSPLPISIDIVQHPRRSHSRNTSRGRMAGTVQSNWTGHSIYHTPSSSFTSSFRPPSFLPSSLTNFSTARSSSPAPSLSNATDSTARAPRHSLDNLSRTGSLRVLPDDAPPSEPALRERPDEGFKLFWASAKTGEGVGGIFRYVADRVVKRAEWEEAHGNGLNELDMAGDGIGYGGSNTVRLSEGTDRAKRRKGWKGVCCS